MRKYLDLAIVALIVCMCAAWPLFGCGGGGSDSTTTDKPAFGAGLAATTLNTYAPPQDQIVVGCATDGSFPHDKVAAYIAAQNADLSNWLLPNWQIGAVVVDGPGDGRFMIQFTGHPSQQDQGYTLTDASGQKICTANMQTSKTPTASASHELYNSLVEAAGGPRICGPVSPLADANGITDATTRAYWAGGAGPWDKMGRLSGPYPAVFAGGAVGL